MKWVLHGLIAGLALRSTAAAQSYVERMVMIVSLNWFKPAEPVRRSPVVRFVVWKDGTVHDVCIVVSSGVPFVDRAALRKVMASSPLPALPESFPGDHLALQMVFDGDGKNEASPSPSPAAPAPIGSTREEGHGVPLIPDNPSYPDRSYLREVGKRIGAGWLRPKEPHWEAVVHFEIRSDGTISKPYLLLPSENPVVNEAAMRAVMAASPLPPIPHASSSSRLGVKAVFK